MPECLIAYIFRNSERLNQVTKRLCFDCCTGRRDTPDLVVFRTPYTRIDTPHVMLALCLRNPNFCVGMSAHARIHRGQDSDITFCTRTVFAKRDG